MTRFISVFFIVLLITSACNTASESNNGDITQTPVEPTSLLNEVIDNVRSVSTFRMILQQEGAPYPFFITLDGGSTNITATFTRGEAQFVNPNVIFANVNLNIGVVISVDLFARNEDQWLRAPGSSAWLHFPFSEGFDPGGIIAEGKGLESAMTKLRDLEFLGEEALDDGTPAYHLRGIAGGEVISELLFNLINPEGDVQMDIFINRDSKQVALINAAMLGTETEENPDPTVWVVEFYDYDAPQDFVAPDGNIEATEEASPDA